MTDPVTILGTAMIVSAIAFPVGVVAGKRQMNEQWRKNVELAKRIARNEHR